MIKCKWVSLGKEVVSRFQRKQKEWYNRERDGRRSFHCRIQFYFDCTIWNTNRWVNETDRKSAERPIFKICYLGIYMWGIYTWFRHFKTWFMYAYFFLMIFTSDQWSTDHSPIDHMKHFIWAIWWGSYHILGWRCS